MRELVNIVVHPRGGSQPLRRGDIVLYKQPMEFEGYNILLSRKVRKGSK